VRQVSPATFLTFCIVFAELKTTPSQTQGGNSGIASHGMAEIGRPKADVEESWQDAIKASKSTTRILILPGMAMFSDYTSAAVQS
jgi:hypothetical protein